MIDSKSLLLASAAFLRKVAGQVATSITAALCVAAVTNAVMKKADPVPTVQPVLVLGAPSASVAAANAAPQPQLQPASFTITGVLQGPSDLAHAFPMEGDPGFQASLSRPFVAMAGEAWAEPKLEYTVMAADEPAPAHRKARPQSAPKAPKLAAPVEVATLPVAAPVGDPVAQGGPVAQETHGLFGFKTPKILSTVDEAVSGVTSAAANLTRFAKFQ